MYATAGIGHKKAAIAVKKALDELNPKDVETTLIDSLDYTNAFFKWTYLKLYLLAVNKLSSLWGFMYYLTDNYFVNLIVSKVRRFNNWLNSRGFERYLLQMKPDIIISTHFFGSEVISDLKRKGALKANLITIVTDYRLHSWWVADFTDTYIVSNQDAREDLIGWDVPDEKIKVLGIPVEPVFSKPLDRRSVIEKLGLKNGVFTILAIGGGFGVGPIEGIVKEIGLVSKPVQVIVICGHNDELVKKMEALRSGLKIDMKVLGFVDNVYEFMEASDILISKAGGITISESLAKNLPMIVISPIPGQETHNSDFITRYGAAVKIDKLPQLKNILEDLITNPKKMDKMREAIKAVRKPAACYDVAILALETIKNG